MDFKMQDVSTTNTADESIPTNEDVSTAHNDAAAQNIATVTLGRSSHLGVIPSAWILLVLVPMFIGTIVVQGYVLSQRLDYREVEIESKSSLQKLANAKNSFNEQSAEWLKILEARKSQTTSLESAIVELESKVKALSAKELVQRSKSEESKSALISLDEKLAERRAELDQVQSETQTVAARTRSMKSANANLREAEIESKAAIIEHENAKTAFKDQSTQWLKIIDARKSQA